MEKSVVVREAPGSKWELGGRGTRNNVISTAVIHNDKVYIGVGQDPEHGEGPGNLWAIDGTKTGDVTESAAVWHLGGEDFHRTMSTVSMRGSKFAERYSQSSRQSSQRYSITRSPPVARRAARLQRLLRERLRPHRGRAPRPLLRRSPPHKPSQ